MICKRYETIVIPFPFPDLPILKRRPMVVLSGLQFNKINGSTLVAMITKAKKPAGQATSCLVTLVVPAFGFNALCAGG